MRTEFFRNVLTVMSGTTLAQVVSVAVYPILSKIYTPDDFGVFALYMSIVSITGIVSTGKYEMAVMLPGEERDGAGLTMLAIGLSLGVSVILLFPAVVLNGEIAGWLGNPVIAPWLVLVPLSTFMVGSFQALNYWHNRHRKFRRMTLANAGQSLVNSGIKVGGGFIRTGAAGLITGMVLGQGAGLALYVRGIFKNGMRFFRGIRLQDIKRLAFRYSLFPRFNMVHGLINNFSGGLPVFVLTSAFSPGVAGLYSLGFTIIFRPMGLVTTALSQVLSQRMIGRVHDQKRLLPGGKRLIGKMLQFSAAPFMLTGIFAPAIFRFVFGAEWEEAGRFTRILIPWLFVLFLSAPFSFVPDVFRRQKTAMYIDIVKFILRIAALITGVFLDDLYLALILFSAASLIMSAWSLYWYFSLLTRHDRKLAQ